MSVVLVAVGAAVGAPLRYWLTTGLDRPDGPPMGTHLVNAVGSLLLGLCVAWSLQDHALALVGTGFCGALTTFSGFVAHVYRLERRVAAAHVALGVLASLGAVTLGYVIGGATS